MLGAIVGDIVGSRFERHNHKSKDFELFTDRCRFTDDTAMTVAIAKALLECKGDYTELSDHTVRCMQEIGRKHPITWLLMQKIGEFLWFFAKFSVCMLLWWAIHL